MTETYTATVDRIVDDRTAVVLLEGDRSAGGRSGDGTDDRDSEGDDRTDEGDDRANEGNDRADDADGRSHAHGDRTDGPAAQLEVDVTQLPADARHDGAVLEVVVDDGTFREATYRPEETASCRESAQERLDRLSERLSDRD